MLPISLLYTCNRAIVHSNQCFLFGWTVRASKDSSHSFRSIKVNRCPRRYFHHNSAKRLWKSSMIDPLPPTHPDQCPWGAPIVPSASEMQPGHQCPVCARQQASPPHLQILRQDPKHEYVILEAYLVITSSHLQYNAAIVHMSTPHAPSELVIIYLMVLHGSVGSVVSS